MPTAPSVTRTSMVCMLLMMTEQISLDADSYAVSYRKEKFGPGPAFTVMYTVLGPPLRSMLSMLEVDFVY